MRISKSKYKKYATGGNIQPLEEDYKTERTMPVLSNTILDSTHSEQYHQDQKYVKEYIDLSKDYIAEKQKWEDSFDKESGPTVDEDWYTKMHTMRARLWELSKEVEDFDQSFPTSSSKRDIYGGGTFEYIGDPYQDSQTPLYVFPKRKPEKIIKLPSRSIEQIPTSEMEGPQKLPPFELMKNNSNHFTIQRQGLHSGTYPKGEDGLALAVLKDQAGRVVWKGSQTEYEEKYGDFLEKGNTEYGERKKDRLYLKSKTYQEPFSFDNPEFGNTLGPIITTDSDNLGSNSKYAYQTKIKGDLIEAQKEDFLAKHFKAPAGNFIPYNTNSDRLEVGDPEPTFRKKVTNTLANPVAAFGYSARNQDVPWGNITPDENNFDMALGMVNPFKWGEYAGMSYDAFLEGDLISGALYGLGALPFIPSSIALGNKIIPKVLNHTNKLNRTRALKTELNSFNNQGVFNSISNNGLSNSQIDILAKNENLANTVVQSAIKNSDKVTAYRAVNVEKALNNPTAVKAMTADGIDLANHSDVAKWLSTRVHTGGATEKANALSSALGRSVDGGLGYRAGGGGSEHFKFGDFAYTLPRKDLIARNTVGGNNVRGFYDPFNLRHRILGNKASTSSGGNTAVKFQANQYGPWVNKLKIKGTDGLIDFSSGTRGDWVNRLQNYVPYKVNINNNSIAPNLDVPFLNAGGVTKINPNSPFVTFTADGSIMNPALQGTKHPNNMFFGPRGKQIFESWSNPVFSPNRVGTGAKSIHKYGGHIRTDNLKRIL